MFGVCCDHPSMFGTEESHKVDGRPPPPSMVMPPNWPPPSMVMPPNWPPPLPTHPPDHTIPPVPTYPPSTTTQSPPMKPPHPPFNKPPTIPPWPPQQQNSTTTTTTSTSSYADNDGFEFQCGLKNGPQDQERIVGGQNADPGEWPWIVSVARFTNKSRHPPTSSYNVPYT